MVLAGSIPASMPDDIYQKIMERLDGRDVRIVVDATKDLLLNVLGHHPFLIKPNNHELGDIFGVKLSEREEVVPYAKKLQEKVRSTCWFRWQARARFFWRRMEASMRRKHRREP